MSNELIKATGLPASLTESINMGKVFFESGLFTDLKSAAQAVVKIQAGAELGIPAFASLSGIHIISGKPAIGAGLIASRVKGSGKYDYKVVEQSDKVCSIDFYQGKELIGNSKFTIEDARKAGTKNMDKFPKNMLFARAISNGVKWFCPDVFAGPVYVPEEMEHSEPIQEAEVVNEPTPTMEEYQELISKCNSKKELVELYKKHRADIDSNPHLQQLISNRRKEIEPSISDDWKEAISNCKNLDELTQLWDGNAEAVEANPALKAFFTNQRTKLQNA